MSDKQPRVGLQIPVEQVKQILPKLEPMRFNVELVGHWLKYRSVHKKPKETPEG